MKLTHLALLKGASWTIGTYGISQFLRALLNLALTRILAPEIFGLMVIVNSIKTGVDLVSDIGIEANIVHSKSAHDPDFYNTAWTLQVIRGLFLWTLCSAASFPLAYFFDAPVLKSLLPVAGSYLAIAGFISVGRYLIQKDLNFAKVNVFEFTVEAFSAFIHLLFAILNPNVWALILGGLAGTLFRTVASYFLLPSVRYKILISKRHAKEILSFGKWIFLSTIVYFSAMSFDRLYLAKAAPLALLGVYGIAKSLAEPFGSVIVRLGNYVVFPSVASSSHMPRDLLRRQLSNVRLMFLAVVAVGLAFFASTADLFVNLIYDQRYQAAGWMLPILILGTWFSIISSLNESVLLGLGKPTYSAFSNVIKLGYLIIALPGAFALQGMPGAVMVVAGGDLCRYFPVLRGQMNERCSFAKQDFFLTLIMMALTVFCEWVRWRVGLGTSLDHL